MPLTRRQVLGASAGVGAAAVAGTGLAGGLWPALSREDLIPGKAPEVALPAGAW